MSRLAAIAVGSNLGSALGGREENLTEAITRMRELGRVSAVSSFRDTAPVGVVDQPRFLNGAVLLETDLSGIALMEALLAIEGAMGRRRLGVMAKGTPGDRPGPAACMRIWWRRRRS